VLARRLLPRFLHSLLLLLLSLLLLSAASAADFLFLFFCNLGAFRSGYAT
jgi:hypothetical protein